MSERQLNADTGRSGGWFGMCALVLACIAIVCSAFHFWPLQDKQFWKMFCLPNLAALVWMVVLLGYVISKRGRSEVASLLPHVSVFAYVGINVLSIAFAAETGRAVSFTAKLGLMFIGGYLLFSAAASCVRSLRIIYGLAITAVIISVLYCLLGKYGFHHSESGFFGSAYKYGSYVGILVPLCAAYLFMSARDWQRLLAVVLVVETLISSSSMGAVIAIATGMVLCAVVVPRLSVRLYIVASLAAGILSLIWLDSAYVNASLHDDVQLTEKDGTNAKQRYIEWQAELNLLEERSNTGTAAGCINDYRSNFYYRLPKLNTLKPFDQNGWLATSGETGILGLVCFCWIVVYYFRLAYSQLTTPSQAAPAAAQRFAIAGLVGLAASCAANVFSAVHYNGVLIAFVLVLALVSRTSAIFGRQTRCE